MGANDQLRMAWARTESALPDGWQLDALLCTSTGLAPHERGDQWRAIAKGPDGQAEEAAAGDPVQALDALRERLG